jgi:hypothetical protein
MSLCHLLGQLHREQGCYFLHHHIERLETAFVLYYVRLLILQIPELGNAIQFSTQMFLSANS